MRLVITGGCGFVGRNLIGLVREQATQLRVVDDLSAGTPDDLEALGPARRLDPRSPRADWGPEIQVLRADVRDLPAMEQACRGADAVVHLAANTGIADSLVDPLGHCSSNVLGTVTVLEACRRQSVSRCIVASSGAAVGDAEPPMHERLLANPVSPYGASKLAAEAYCQAYRGAFGQTVVALRFSNVYGPHSGHKTSVVARFLTTILEDRPLTIYGDGQQTRDFIFVRDLTTAIWAALRTPGPLSPVYQIASGVETSINALFELLGDLAETRLGRRPRVLKEPRRAGEVARNFADISLARKELGFDPATPLARGLETTMDWFLSKRNGSRKPTP